jgi:mono/diheme cytochrome c family protein/plastocyanin
MNRERAARLFVLVLVAALGLGVALARYDAGSAAAIDVHARMAGAGGWSPSDLQATAGEPLRLRLTSDDVLHGFAVGQSDLPAVDVKPGQFSEVELTFDQPGRYIYYCTRWCGPDHWRMTGAILVSPPGGGEVPQPTPEPPLYVRLGQDIDAAHPAAVVPELTPSAARGAALGIALPARYRDRVYYRAHSPAAAWQELRADPLTRGLSAADVWDLVALAWQMQTTPAEIDEARELYSANCAACHGAGGAGDGVFAATPLPPAHAAEGSHDLKAPAKLNDPASMLGASPAILHGKISRGGMGTGMPYWGPILTDRQIWALVSYLWSFTLGTPAGAR